MSHAALKIVLLVLSLLRQISHAKSIDTNLYGKAGFVPINVFATVDRRRRSLSVRKKIQLFPHDNLARVSAIVSPVEFGADPTGQYDSTGALNEAIMYMMSLSNQTDDQNRVDLGGATLDLNGGIYSISASVRFPPGFSNFRIQRGTLVARSNFTTGPGLFMLSIGGDSCSSSSGGKNNKNCNTNVDITEMTIDGKNIAYGGILVKDVMDVNIGPAIFMVGFEHVGISMDGSGAGFLHEMWLGQYEPGNPTPRADATATAILLSGEEHDCDVSNVIVFVGSPCARTMRS